MADPIKLDDSGNTSGSSPKINLGSPSIDNGGSMGNIFTQNQAKKDDSKMISSIISQKEVAQKTKSILGPAPTLEKTIEQEKEASLKRKLRFYQFVFLVLFVACAAMSFYFYSELSPDFTLLGANTTQRLSDTNDNLRQVQTQVSKDQYLAAQLQLNEFSYEADRFFSSVQKVNDPTINSFDKRTIFADLDESQKALPVLLGNVRDLLSKDIIAQTYPTEKEPQLDQNVILQNAQTDLRNALSDEKKKYGQNPTNAQDIQDVKLIDNAMKLVGNINLQNVLQATSSDALQTQLNDYVQNPDPQKLQALQDAIGKILSSTKSDLATIANIKQSRIQWSTIISQIKEVTLTIDPNFDQQQLYDALGGVVYTGYEFDSNSNKIVLSGTTKTLDGSNFTLMSNLIDRLESSPYFQSVDMRSFSKSKPASGSGSGYLANFKIDLSLEPQGTSNTNNAPVSLQNTSSAAQTGTKRTTGTDTSTQQSTVAPGAVTSSEQSTLNGAAIQPSSVSSGGSASAPVSPAAPTSTAAAASSASSQQTSDSGASSSVPAGTQQVSS